MIQPRISVIIPLFNIEKYLRKCVDSVIAQTYQNLEIILVDDGSTDSSGKICDEYKEMDERIVVIHQEYKGVAESRNIGLEHATGEYIAFVDSDDFVVPDMIEVLYFLCVNNEADLSICRFRMIDEDGKYITEEGTEKIWIMDSNTTMNYYLKEYPEILITPSVWGKLFARKVIEGLSFPTGRVCEDLVFTTKSIYNSNRIVYVDKSLYFYLRRRGSIMNDSGALVERVSDEWNQYECRIKFFEECSEKEFVNICYAKLYFRLLCRYDELKDYSGTDTKKICYQIRDRLKQIKKKAKQEIYFLPMSKNDLLRVSISFISISLYSALRKMRTR